MKQPHIQLDETLNIKYAILPGDPGRIDKIIPFLEDAKEIVFNREYRSVTGTYKGVPILAMSTGMGGVSTAIGVEELAKIGIKYAIRIGSCGSLQDDVKMGDLLIPTGVVRDDGTTGAYIRQTYPAVPDFKLLNAIVASADESGVRYHLGITRSHESFYAEAENAQISYWTKQGILGEDMESSPLMVVARLRGIKAASILNNVSPSKHTSESSSDVAANIANYVEGNGSAERGEKNEILLALEAFVLLEK